jgi:hypothetical protein
MQQGGGPSQVCLPASGLRTDLRKTRAATTTARRGQSVGPCGDDAPPVRAAQQPQQTTGAALPAGERFRVRHASSWGRCWWAMRRLHGLAAVSPEEAKPGASSNLAVSVDSVLYLFMVDLDFRVSLFFFQPKLCFGFLLFFPMS